MDILSEFDEPTDAIDYKKGRVNLNELLDDYQSEKDLTTGIEDVNIESDGCKIDRDCESALINGICHNKKCECKFNWKKRSGYCCK